MHEILAPLIFVIHCDHQSYLFAQENGLLELVVPKIRDNKFCSLFMFICFVNREEIHELLDANYLEHDSYFLFTHVMERIESWYDNNSIKTIKVRKSFGLEW